MGSQTDLDQGGTNRRWKRTYLGPSLGWQQAPDTASELVISAGGTTLIYPGTSLIKVNVAALVTLNLYQAKGSAAGAQANPGTFLGTPLVIVDQGGNANTYNITINAFNAGNGTETIDDFDSIAIKIAYGAYVLTPNVGAGGWTLTQS